MNKHVFAYNLSPDKKKKKNHDKCNLFYEKTSFSLI